MSSLTNWYFRTGYGGLVVWREDDGQSLYTSMARPLAFDDAPEYRELADGGEDEVARRRGVAPELVGQYETDLLRAWKAEGARVKAILIHRGQGRHYIWHEPNRVNLAPFDGLPGGLAGDRLRLFTAKYGAAIYESPNLLAPLTFEDGGDWTLYESDASGGVTWGADADGNDTATLSADPGETSALYVDVVLPAPGLRLNFAAAISSLPDLANAAVRLRIVALTYAEHADGGGPVAYGAEAATATTEGMLEDEAEGVVYTLPAGTYAVRVAVEIEADAGAGAAQDVVLKLPALLTRALSGRRAARQQYGLTFVDNGDGTLTLHVSSPSALAGSGGGSGYTLTVPAAAVTGADGNLTTLLTDSE